MYTNAANESIIRRLSAVKAERKPAPIDAAAIYEAAAKYMADVTANAEELSAIAAAKKDEAAAKKNFAAVMSIIAKRRQADEIAADSDDPDEPGDSEETAADSEETAADSGGPDESVVNGKTAADDDEFADFGDEKDEIEIALANAAEWLRDKFGGEPSAYRIAYKAAMTARDIAAKAINAAEDAEAKADSAAVSIDGILGGDTILLWMRWETAADLEADAAESEYRAAKETAAIAKETAAKVKSDKQATDADNTAAENALTAANKKLDEAKVRRDETAAKAEAAAAIAPAYGFGIRSTFNAARPGKALAAAHSLLNGIVGNLPTAAGTIRETRAAYNIFKHRNLIVPAARAVVRRTAKNCISREGTATQWEIYFDTAAGRWESHDVADMVSAAAECFAIAAAPASGIAQETYSAAVMEKYAAIAGKLADSDGIARAAVMNIGRRQTGAHGISDTDRKVDAAELDGFAARLNAAKEKHTEASKELNAAKRELNAAKRELMEIEAEISGYAAIRNQIAAVGDEKLSAFCKADGMDIGEIRRRRVNYFEECGTAMEAAAAERKSAAVRVSEHIRGMEKYTVAVKEADAAVKKAEAEYYECASRRRQKYDSAADYDARITENDDVVKTRAAIIGRAAAARADYSRAMESGNVTAAAEAANAAILTGYAAVNAYLADMRAIRVSRNPAAIDIDGLANVLIDYRDILGGDTMAEAAASKREILLDAIPAAMAEMTAAQRRVMNAMSRTCGDASAAARIIKRDESTVREHVAAIAKIVAVKIAEVASGTEIAETAEKDAETAAYDAKVYKKIAEEIRKNAADVRKIERAKKDAAAEQKKVAAAAVINASGADAKSRTRRRVIAEIAAMPPKMREITEKLAAGMTIRAAAEQLGKGKSTIMEAKKAAAKRIVCAINEELPEIAAGIDLNAATIKEIIDMLA